LLLLCNYAVIFCGFSSVVVSFSASSYDIEINENFAIIQVQVFGEFRDPFTVTIITSAEEQGMSILTHLHHMYHISTVYYIPQCT